MEIKGINIKKILDEMSLDEKISMLTGDGMWNVRGTEELPSVRMSDGPTGLRMTDNSIEAAVATCFPTESALACTWDKNAVRKVGEAIAEEATAMGVNVLLAPGVNIKRNPLCGRNFEYFSEDPLLSGTLGKAYIEGVQSVEVGACLKHFCLNSQETLRMTSDSVVDERALHEIYLPAFKKALEANPSMVMCAYNKVDGEYCSQNARLLRTVLRDEWGYKGVTVSDWGAVHDRAKALAAGLDLQMPDDKGMFAGQIKAAVESGEIDEKLIDESVYRLIELADNVYLEPYGEIEFEAHNELCYKVALESVVLLKNDGILPITPDKKIAITGNYCDRSDFQGCGSSRVNPYKSLTAFEAFTARDRGIDYIPYKSEADLNEVILKTADSDIVIVYTGLINEAEGADRKNMQLPPDQNTLINTLIGAGRTVAVVLHTGCAVEMPWALKTRAIVQGGLGGQMCSAAVADILLGRAVPQGKLAESYPARYRDAITSDFYAKDNKTVDYRESIYVGYRYYDKAGMGVMFPFGYGLSYCKTEFSELAVRRVNDGFDVTFSIKNPSPRGTYDVAQIYIFDKTGAQFVPEKQLAAFEKVFINADSATTVTIKVPFTAFNRYDTKNKRFTVCGGDYIIAVGNSSADLYLKKTVTLEGDKIDESGVPNWYLTLDGAVKRTDFESLIGRTLSEPPRPLKRQYTLLNTINDISHTLIGKILLKKLTQLAAKDPASFCGAADIPLDVLPSFSDGAITVDMARGFVDLANGKYFRGIRRVLHRAKSEKK